MWPVQMLSLWTIFEETERSYQLSAQSSCFTPSPFPQPSSSLPLPVFVICSPEFSLEGDDSLWLGGITEGQQRISSTARQLYCSNGLRRLHSLSELGRGLETHTWWQRGELAWSEQRKGYDLVIITWYNKRIGTKGHHFPEGASCWVEVTPA